ncbi:hypothetical protein IT6_09595 [Methylacidiphilum caldifontis]|uniref:hypothetical protein n=1 Tax=Methylacidiphilum caldifontis TaxID=2795386 RepID=UPI001A90A654|nr:hypothetical protein [Methylacidiphilum caldifontis]QSR88602.1 hypothetical protein IT6_09595 [Methylacidiphilum caldifontis]
MLRNYWASVFENKGIFTLPLGWTVKHNILVFKPINQKKHIWCFVGQHNPERELMINTLKSITPNYYKIIFNNNDRLDYKAYFDIMTDSIFHPCPMGNVVLETFRIYEALEFGGIPIIIKRRNFDYFNKILPNNTVPQVKTWKQACDLIRGMFKDEKLLTTTQLTISNWWDSFKIKLKNKVSSFVTDGFEGKLKLYLQNIHSYNDFIHDLWRRNELLKHQSFYTAIKRIQKSVRERGISILWQGGPKFKHNQ